MPAQVVWRGDAHTADLLADAHREHIALYALAGADWRRFLVANAAGAIVWASAVGFGTYFFGRAVMHVTRPVGIALAAVALAIIVGALLFVRAHEAELEAEALGALEGAISSPAWKNKPSWYLEVTDDRMIPPPAQRLMSKRAGAKVTDSAGSHAIYVSRPEEVAAIIRTATQA